MRIKLTRRPFLPQTGLKVLAQKPKKAGETEKPCSSFPAERSLRHAVAAAFESLVERTDLGLKLAWRGVDHM